MKDEFTYFNDEWNPKDISSLEFMKYVRIKDKDGNLKPIELRNIDIQFLKDKDADKRTK